MASEQTTIEDAVPNRNILVSKFCAVDDASA